jgi:hypothetical protein
MLLAGTARMKGVDRTLRFAYVAETKRTRGRERMKRKIFTPRPGSERDRPGALFVEIPVNQP